MQNSTLAALTAKAPQNVLSAIQTASRKTGVDFAYMVQQAAAESAFNPSAKAGTSSATGLYQFIESTWLNMVDRYGEKHGIDPNQSRESLLALRKDPDTASLFAAEFANENKRYLETNVGGEIGATELYFAHFLGAGGAAGFLNALKEDPYTVGAHIFPKESRANRGVFYDSQTGEARTLKQIYAFFDKKFNFSAQKTDSVQVAANAESAPRPAAKPQKSYVHINPSVNKPLHYIRTRSQLDAVQALLAFPADNARDQGGYARLATSMYSRMAMSPADFLSLYKTDTKI